VGPTVVCYPGSQNRDLGHPTIVVGLGNAKAGPSLRLKNGYGQDDNYAFAENEKRESERECYPTHARKSRAWMGHPNLWVGQAAFAIQPKIVRGQCPGRYWWLD
jgi:hypothetical protein